MDFRRFFGNFIANLYVSDNKLQAFSLDHIQRITVNNSTGVFADILNNTVKCYEDFFGKIADEDVSFAVQQSLTLSADNLLKEFKMNVSQKEGIIRGIFGAKSSVYQEFFPTGLTEYSALTKTNAELLINRIVAAATKYQADLGSNFVQLFSQIQSNYKVSRSLQLAKIGEVKVTKLNAATNRELLELQICRNIHYIGYTYPADVARCMTFFDQSIIQKNNYTHSDGLGRIAITVVNAATNEPIRGATLHITDGKITDVQTNSSGKARTNNIAVGSYIITVTKEGYETHTDKIEVFDEDQTLLSVGLIEN